MNNELPHCIEYYRKQGAPGDQQMLIALLREAQDLDGGTLSRQTMGRIADACGLQPALLNALVRRIPALRSDDVPHRLEICGNCGRAAGLTDYIEQNYQVRSGSCSSGGFFYRITGCMKNCRQSPSIRWDGTLYSHADAVLLDELILKG